MTTTKAQLIFFTFIVFIFCQYSVLEAQVTIGSPLPPERGALLDLKEKNADINAGNLETAKSGGLLLPRIYLSDSNSLSPIIDSSFISNNASEYEKLKLSHTGLLIYNLTASEGKGLSQGLYKWDGNIWNSVVDSNQLTGCVKQLKASSIPHPAVFVLKQNVNNFLNGVALGGKQVFGMSQMVNTIPEYIQLSADGTKLTFAPGLYLIQFTYGAIHNIGCTSSSYFMDFPNDNYPTQNVRVHSTSYHRSYANSDHGDTITNACLLSKSVVWDIALGRGQSGTCKGKGMTLYANSTFLHIVKYNHQ